MIPNRFHFVFGLKEQTEPFHLMFYLCLASCLEVNRPLEVKFHYHHEPYGPWWDRIKPRLTLQRIEPDHFVTDYVYQDAAIAPFRYAHLADFARLHILQQEGGIYADIDTLFLRPFPPEWLQQRQFILGRERVVEGEGVAGSLCNAWIASAPGAEFGRLWLEQSSEAFDGSWSEHSTLLPYRLGMQHPDLLHVEPEQSFYALDWSPADINALFCRRVELPTQAYSLHLWNHLWWSASRLDFSPFHQGLLTADYVAFANTTYAHHARRFLPNDLALHAGRHQVRQWAAFLRHPRMHWLARRETAGWR